MDADGFYVDQPARTELTYACSQGGKTAYLYGDSYDPQATPTYPPDAVANSKNKGTFPPYDQLTFFNTTIPQWEGPCNGLCRARGGIGLDVATDVRCDRGTETLPYSQGAIGFRCCTD